jgi:hypothetical protein
VGGVEATIVVATGGYLDFRDVSTFEILAFFEKWRSNGGNS